MELSNAAKIFYGDESDAEKVRQLQALLPDTEARGYLGSLARSQRTSRSPSQVGTATKPPPRSRFQNCFYYFRGPGGKTEGAQQRQLEDNATKALINVLEYSSSDITHSFLGEVVGNEVTDSDAEPEFFLQGGPETPAARRLLLGIALEGRIGESLWDQDGGSRVDAGISIPGDVTVLVETKVVAELDGGQLMRHAQEWDIPLAVASGEGHQLPPEWVLVKWADVHRWCKRQAGETSEQPSRFLLQQLVEFLELAGLAPTWVLRPEHFEYFEQAPADRDPAIALEIKTRLESLWARVEERLGEAGSRAALGEVRVGNLGSEDSAWAQSHAETQGFEKVNLTIEIWPGEATLNLVGWFKQQATTLEDWLLSRGGQAFVEAHPDFELVVFVVRGTPTKKGRVMWRGAKGEEVARLSGSDLRLGPLAHRLVAVREVHHDAHERLGFHYRRSWSREEAVDREDLALEIASEIEELISPLAKLRSEL